MASMKLSFSLKSKAKAEPVGTTPVFTSLDDEAVTSVPSGSKKLVAQSSLATRAMKKKMAEEKKVDETVYEYDEVWDRMKAAERKSKVEKENEARERKPKYIGALLTASVTRKLDYVRAEEKMIQREREAEGDEFAGKEAFVTQAYKDQMAAVRKAEEEEKEREEKEKKKGGGTGMVHFYRALLEKSDEAHAATVAATTEKRPVLGPSFTITKPVAISDVERAKIAREQGKDVELNDDNQIVDKRELLSAGLNLSAPNTRRLTKSTSKSRETEPVVVHTAVGSAASRRQINERRAKEIAVQLEEESVRVKEQRELEEKEQRERVLLKRNDEEAVQSAKERYLERKRRKLEDGTAMEIG